MGAIRIPPQPQFMMLEDRDEPGLYWGISWADYGGGRRVSINTDVLERGALDPRTDAVYYPANHGPVLEGSPPVRMLVRGGRLGYEVISDRVDQALVLGRRGVWKRWFEVFRHSSWMFPFRTQFRRGLKQTEVLP